MPSSWTNEALTNLLGPVVSAYFPAQGDIRVALGVFAGNQPVFATFRSGGSHAPSGNSVASVDEDTIFEIGSTTMAFTAYLLADMVSRNVLQLADPVKSFLPGVRVPSYRGQDITLLDLANHTSALPRLPMNFPETVIDPANPCGNYTVEDLYAFLAGYRPRGAIGWRHEYSNLAMGLLGHVLGLAAHQDYEAALRERVCAPLGLCDTTVTLTAAQAARFVQGHTALGQPAPPWDMPALVGAGGLRSTARELLRFLQAHMAKDGPGQKAAALCGTPMPKSGRPAGWLARYGAAASLSALALIGAWYFSMTPGRGWFFPLFLLPVLLAALVGGIGPGLLAATSQNFGAWFLYGESFNVLLHGAAGLVLAWTASSNHRARARPEYLGWQQTRRGLMGFGPRILWHSGETGGYASFIGLDTKEDIAVVLLSNCAKPVAPLGFQVLDALNER